MDQYVQVLKTTQQKDSFRKTELCESCTDTGGRSYRDEGATKSHNKYEM